MELAGDGTHDIRYEVIGESGCQNASVRTVKVHPEPQLEILGLDPSYCYNADTVVFSGNFDGGELFGEGVTDLGNGQAMFVAQQAACE